MKPKILVYIFSLTSAVTCQLQCHVEGEVDGTFYDVHAVTSYNECLAFCNADSFCDCFTYYKDINECAEFSVCQSLNATCTNCFSGQHNCTEFYDCDIDGLCNGDLVGISTADTEYDCLSQCEDNPACEYYAYRGDDGSCVLLKDCAVVNPCENCHSGQRDCTLSPLGDLTILMVVGGHPDPAHYDVELIDMTNQGRTCRKPDNYLGSERGAVGAYIGGRVKVCGGYVETSACYDYNPEDGTWIPTTPMNVIRYFATSTVIQDQWWITGGDNHVSKETLSSTEVWNDVNSSFTQFVDLPAARELHNLVTLDNGTVVLFGGQSEFNETYTFNPITQTWSVGPALSNSRRQGQGGLFTFSNGTTVVVATGGVTYRSTEFLNLDEGYWSFGPDLPDKTYNGASVQLPNGFLVVGGYSNTNETDVIWKFDGGWILLEQRLQIPRQVTSAFLVPDDFC